MTASAGIAILVAADGWLHAQTMTAPPYPTDHIKMIVPVAAGSTADTVARLISDPLGKALAVSVVIENRPGARGVPGTQHLVRSPSDGATIGMVSSNYVINPSISRSMPFDSNKDITAISVLGSVPLMLVVGSKIGARDLQELIALAEAKPGSLNYGSAGIGSALHFAAILFTRDAGIDVRHVPYRDQALLISDLRAGRMDMAFLSVPVARDHVRSGTLRPIGVSTPTRVSLFPEVPSLAEMGLSRYSFDAWIAMIGPAALPKAVVDRLYSETKAILGMRRLQQSFASQGITTIESDPDSSARFLAAELAKYEALARQAGIDRQ